MIGSTFFFVISWSIPVFIYLFINYYDSALLESEDDLIRKTEEGWGPVSEEIDIRELKDEVGVLLDSWKI